MIITASDKGRFKAYHVYHVGNRAFVIETARDYATRSIAIRALRTVLSSAATLTGTRIPFAVKAA